MAKEIYQIQIELLRSKPGIWRRILIPSNMLLSDLHKVLQTTMGWTNSHLHQFIKDRIFYTLRMPDDDSWEEMDNVDYKGMTISNLLEKENDRIIYEYDFGDCWEHELLLERILPAEADRYYPVCIGGRMNCPPEDCGGIPGYLEMVKILEQPGHEEYEGYINWLGRAFNPLSFSKKTANELLARKDYGCYAGSNILPDQYPAEDFEGYSPHEMHFILYYTFNDDSPIKLQKLTEAEYRNIPIFNQVKYLANVLAEHKELKLTKLGFLPVKVVADIYSQGFMKDKHIESGISKLYKETDSMTIHLPRILLEISGLTKKRNNKLSLTKKGEKIIQDDYKFLSLIINIFTSKFNWAYFDGYGENKIGQLGFGFSLILMSKYGHEKQAHTFYSDKYFKAFPQFIQDAVVPSYTTLERYTSNCYSIRTFDRFLEYFGLVKINQEKGWDTPKFVAKTDLFDKLIQISPPDAIE